MRLSRRSESFDSDDFIFELKIETASVRWPTSRMASTTSFHGTGTRSATSKVWRSGWARTSESKAPFSTATRPRPSCAMRQRREDACRDNRFRNCCGYIHLSRKTTREFALERESGYHAATFIEGVNELALVPPGGRG